MKRIGVCTYTKRWPKGTSRARRLRDLRTFRLTALIVSENFQRVLPAIRRAQMDSLIYGTGRVDVTWD